ncbi:aldo/keto reductase [Herbiconiux moechotypicola]|uniref:Aldo/keto reductase n=1 Tax=Herbiconiux moechotypicola TaxID=637393 RepID=A0ABP5QCM5_9MICO|nr:aldo/keto reductase [Herbiconiux moechotypicola]MCS5729325.1 aldo/keto reductase [Herbiconiux moechotypicola]
MRTARLGERGPLVSTVGLGTMSLLTSNDQDAVTRLVHEALDAGITLVDTADVYCDGAVERALAPALRGRRDEVVLATKAGLPMDGDPLRSGGSARWITQAADDSLRRLGTDRLDLFQLHRPDPATPIEETMAAFDDLIRAGKVRFAGSSVFPAELLVQSAWAASDAGSAPLVSEQAPYSVFVRGIEASVLPTARRLGMGVIAWGPLNGGWLTGKYRRGAAAPEGSRAASGNPFVRADDETKLTLVERLSTVAHDEGVDLTSLSLGWAQEHPAITSILVGPRTSGQLHELLQASETVLSTAALDAIDAIVAPGTNVDPRNAGWTSPALSPGERRRERA